jgi:hypothetical protein
MLVLDADRRDDTADQQQGDADEQNALESSLCERPGDDEAGARDGDQARYAGDSVVDG